MGTNPMQRMKRNSILTGLTVGLAIGLVLCGCLYVFLTGPGKNITSGDTKAVYVLGTTVKSGETITLANIKEKIVSIEDVPADAVSISKDVVAKIDLSAGTILTGGMISASDDDKLTNDLRIQEYNMISLPTTLSAGNFIDIRLQLPNGGDYIVVSKKKVLKCNSTTVWLNMYEEEIELMSNAIIEYYIMAGSKLYATIYTDPGLQTASVGTYVPNSTVSSLISANPNIKSYINSDRYSESLKAIRNNYISSSINEYSDSAISNIEENIKDEIENLKESREAYFGTLNSAQ